VGDNSGAGWFHLAAAVASGTTVVVVVVFRDGSGGGALAAYNAPLRRVMWRQSRRAIAPTADATVHFQLPEGAKCPCAKTTARGFLWNAPTDNRLVKADAIETLAQPLL
jgi:hypothetical protein